jgi:predicted nucleic acid-binding protein
MKNESWVINASPLILFGKLRRLDLLEKLTSNVYVPCSVFNEVLVGVNKYPITKSTLEWAENRQVNDLKLSDSIVRWDLGIGESQVIANALSSGFRAVLDDGKGRACALSHSLPIIGSLGIILRSKQQGLVSAAKPLIEQLRISGSFLDDKLVAQVLIMLGEV